MTREEHLKFCTVCKNQKFDMQQGVICSLTDQPADFEESCSSYVEDVVLKQKVELTEVDHEILRRTASQGKRLANHLIDFVSLIFFHFIFGSFLGIVLSIISPSSLSIFTEENVLVDYLLGFTATMLYYTVLEATTGKTVGKLITQTKVVNDQGQIPDIGTILLRSLCRFIPFEAFSFLGSDGSGWHDKLSNTRVIEI